MSFRINDTTVIDGSRNLTNIANQTVFVRTGAANNPAFEVGAVAALFNVGGTINATGTVAGTSLRYTNQVSDTFNPLRLSQGSAIPGQVTLSGTWRNISSRCLGTVTSSDSTSYFSGLWLRIS